MLGYTWIQWLFFFFFYSFFGWCFESTYVSLHEKRFVNRGFIRGPFLPLYGTGALMMLIFCPHGPKALRTARHLGYFAKGKNPGLATRSALAASGRGEGEDRKDVFTK